MVCIGCFGYAICLFVCVLVIGLILSLVVSFLGDFGLFVCVYVWIVCGCIVGLGFVIAVVTFVYFNCFVGVTIWLFALFGNLLCSCLYVCFVVIVGCRLLVWF